MSFAKNKQELIPNTKEIQKNKRKCNSKSIYCVFSENKSEFEANISNGEVSKIVLGFIHFNVFH